MKNPVPGSGLSEIGAWHRFVALGARVHSAFLDVGEGIRTAELADPFGNVLGLIQNPLFDPSAVR
ncbi:VOC family protein [Pseudoduganella plicata]|uniref:Glyoxalase n=1 Tax=Pseudoduganella plicata TaxID=321984 RepID=A0A4P7BFZ5_9BURK|nr:hypothetical protein [Pseudoduganella plicata]QBQ37180.1 hypothetical protein E1742_14115 [Pseudoduganella plicata]GGY98717.1 hypothetical protein GCM10007388_35330 [Pseudoduganella plicata]